MKNLKGNNDIVFFIWESVSSIFLGIVMSHYLGPIMSFGILGMAVLLLYFPVKIVKKKTDSFLARKNIIVSSVGSIGLAFIIWYYLYAHINVPNSIWSIFFVIFLSICLFPLLALFYSFFKRECRDKYGDNKERFFLYVPAIVFFCVCVFIQPVDIFLHNSDEIPISLWDTIVSMLYYIPFLLLSFYFLFCLPFSVLRVIGTIIGALNISAYLQLMFFNKYVGQLIGGEYSWIEHPFYTYITLGVWIAIFVVSLICTKYKKTIQGIVFLNLTVFTLLSVALISTFISSSQKDPFQRNEKYYRILDGSEQFTVGKEENIIFLVADSVDNAFIKEVYNNNPGFFDEFSDFTMYLDTCSVYDYTVYSVPQMLYGYTHKDGTEKTKPFMERFTEHGFRFLFYSYSTLDVPGGPEKYIGNFTYSEDISGHMILHKSYVRQNYAKVVLYQLLPCILKRQASISKVNFDTCLDTTEKEAEFSFKVNNQEFDQALTLTYNKYSSKCFIYQHIDGAHPPCEDCLETSKYCLGIFKKYLKQMKELGVYDNAVIIIAADHGVHDGVEGYPFPTPATPMFMIKGKNEEHDAIVVSEKPMYYQDIQSTVLFYSGLSKSGDTEYFGRSINDIYEGEIRTRVWFNTDGGKSIRKYTYRGDTKELERVVHDNIYEDVNDFSFDFKELAD